MFLFLIPRNLYLIIVKLFLGLRSRSPTVTSLLSTCSSQNNVLKSRVHNLLGMVAGFSWTYYGTDLYLVRFPGVIYNIT